MARLRRPMLTGVPFGLIVCMIGAYIVGHRRGSRLFGRLSDHLRTAAREALGERAYIQFPVGATFLVEDSDEYSHGDDPDREALNSFDQQFITWRERIDCSPGTPDEDKVEYRYSLTAMEAWEDRECYLRNTNWAATLRYLPESGEESAFPTVL